MSIMKFYEIFTCHPTNPPLNPKQKPKYDYLTMCRLYTGTDSSKSPVLLEFDQGDGMLWSRAQFPDVPWKLLIQPWVSGANDIQWQHPNLMQLLKQPLSWSGLKQNQVPRTKSHVLAWSNQLTNRVTSCANKLFDWGALTRSLQGTFLVSNVSSKSSSMVNNQHVCG